MEDKNSNSNLQSLEIKARGNLRKAQKDANYYRASARVMAHCAVMQIGFFGGSPALAPVGIALAVMFGEFSAIARWGASNSDKEALEFAGDVWDVSSRPSKTAEEKIQRLQAENEELVKDRKSLTSQQLGSLGYAAVQYMLLVPKVIQSVGAFMAQPSALTAAAVVAYGGVALVTAGGFGDFLNKIPQKAKIRRRMRRNINKIDLERALIERKKKERQKAVQPVLDKCSVRIININPQLMDLSNARKIAGAPEEDKKKDLRRKSSVKTGKNRNNTDSFHGDR